MKNFAYAGFALALVLAVASCGKKQEQAAAPKNEPKKEEQKKIVDTKKVEESTTKRVHLGDLKEVYKDSPMADYLKTFLNVPSSKFMSANCFRRIEFQFKDGGTLEALEIYNVPCQGLDVQKPQTAALDRLYKKTRSDHRLYSMGLEGERDVLIANLMETGMIPGPNIFRLSDFCSDLSQDEHKAKDSAPVVTWHACSYTVDRTSGKLSDYRINNVR